MNEDVKKALSEAKAKEDESIYQDFLIWKHENKFK